MRGCSLTHVGEPPFNTRDNMKSDLRQWIVNVDVAGAATDRKHGGFEILNAS